MTSPFAFVLDNGNERLHAQDSDDALQLTMAFVDEFQLSSSVDSTGINTATPSPQQYQELLPSPELVSQELLAQVLDVELDQQLQQYATDDGTLSHSTHTALTEADGSRVEQVAVSRVNTTTKLSRSAAIEADTWLSRQVTQLEPAIFAPINQPTTKNKKAIKKQQPQQLTKSISGGSSSTNRRPTTTRHVSNKARDERKEEIIYLRKKVSELEHQLIKHQSTPGSSQVRSSITAHPGTSSDPLALPTTSVWQEIVSRQYSQRVRAERENIRLKLVLENQLKIAKSLEKVLQKTTNGKNFEDLIYGMRPSYSLYSLPPQASSDSDDSRQLFEELLAGMDQSYAEAESIFQTHEVTRVETSPTGIDAVIRSDESGGIQLQVIANKMLPFSMRAAGSAVWHHYAFAKERLPNRAYHHISPQTLNTEEDSIFEDFNLEIELDSATALFHGKQVTRRYIEENRIVIVWRAFFDPLHIADEPTLGVRFLERVYIVIKNVQGGSVTKNETNNVLQTCYISTPIRTGDLADADSTIIRTITDFTLNATAANISSSYEMIENVLLEHATKAQFMSIKRFSGDHLPIVNYCCEFVITDESANFSLALTGFLGILEIAPKLHARRVHTSPNEEFGQPFVAVRGAQSELRVWNTRQPHATRPRFASMVSSFEFTLGHSDEADDVLLAVPESDDTLQLALAFVDEFQLFPSTPHSARTIPAPLLQPQELALSPELVSQELLAQVLLDEKLHQDTSDDGTHMAQSALAETDDSLVEQVPLQTGITELLQSATISTPTWHSGHDTQQQQSSDPEGLFAPIEATNKNKKGKKQSTQQLTKSISSSSVATRGIYTRHPSNKARDERKEELIYLRKKVSDLEQQLMKSRQKYLSKSDPQSDCALLQPLSSTTRDSGICSDKPSTLPTTSVWQEIVSRQYSQRVKAERENIQLKLVLENQLKIAKSLEEVLEKTTSTRDFENLIRRMKPSFALYSLPPQATDPSDARRVFEELLSGLDESYAEAEAVFAANGVARMETSTIDTVIRSDESVGIELEVFGKKVLPFDMRAAGLVVWHHYAFAKDRIPNRVYHHISPPTLNATEDTILEDFNLELDVNSATALFHAKNVMRRYTEENRIVIVWRAFYDPLHIANEPTPGVRFLERGFIVIKQTLPAATGTVNNVLQTCYISTPIRTGDLVEADPSILQTIIDFSLRTTAANISSSYEIIENVLLEHAIKAQYVK